MSEENFSLTSFVKVDAGEEAMGGSLGQLTHKMEWLYNYIVSKGRSYRLETDIIDVDPGALMTIQIGWSTPKKGYIQDCLKIEGCSGGTFEKARALYTYAANLVGRSHVPSFGLPVLRATYSEGEAVNISLMSAVEELYRECVFCHHVPENVCCGSMKYWCFHCFSELLKSPSRMSCFICQTTALLFLESIKARGVRWYELTRKDGFIYCHIKCKYMSLLVLIDTLKKKIYTYRRITTSTPSSSRSWPRPMNRWQCCIVNDIARKHGRCRPQRVIWTRLLGDPYLEEFSHDRFCRLIINTIAIRHPHIHRSAKNDAKIKKLYRFINLAVNRGAPILLAPIAEQ